MSTLLVIVAVFFGLILLLLAAGAWQKARLKAAYPPPGRMVDIGGYRLHAVVQGAGAYSVIFDSGVGGIAAHWEKVQPEIAKHAVTLAYDRAGLGWSDPAPQPRSFETMAGELKALLDAAGVPAPYVLVGHSFGGVVVRQFARAHPDQVAGIVLVDSAHEEQFTERFPAEVRAMAPKMVSRMRPMVRAFASGIPALLMNRIPATAGLSDSATQGERAVRVMGSSHIRTMLDEMAAIVHRPPPALESLGGVPLVVLAHGVAQSTPMMSDEVNAAYEAAWQDMQRELAGLSSVSQHRVVEGSGHDIQLEQPQAVIEAIGWVMAAGRESAA